MDSLHLKANQEYEKDLIKRLEQQKVYIQEKLKDNPSFKKQSDLICALAYIEGQLKYYKQNPMCLNDTKHS